MDAKTLRQLMIERGLSVKEGSESSRLLALERAIKLTINTKNQSDRTCLKNVISWLKEKFQSGKFDINEIPSRIIDYALEAAAPECRNHWAVFMHILKKELGYPN